MSGTAQPDWECIANLGDVSPIDSGGFFVLTDRTGVYEAEAVLLWAPDEDPALASTPAWEASRIVLDRCTWTDGVLSDNACHPESPAWFAEDLGRVARSSGCGEADIRAALCDADPLRRAWAYRLLAEYHGVANFDETPDYLTRDEAEARYAAWARAGRRPA